jgi:CheY-like chemotaxis protein
MDNQLSLTAKEAAIESELGNIAKGTFIANLDHKLRAPMNSIMGMLNLLEETQLNDHQQGYVESALEASKYLLETINQITDFPVNSYELELKDHPFDLFKAGKNVIKAFSGMASTKKISLQFECEAKTPTLLNGDPLKLQQVLAKVIENALNFTEKGSVKLTTSFMGNEDDKALIQFKIKDTGPGISNEKLKNLFDFTHDVFSNNPKLRRVSLELAVCKKIVEEMGGKIEVSSVKEEGTEVTVQIPFMETPPEVIDQISKVQEVVVKKNSGSFRSFNGLKVLLAEDDPINQSLAVAFLEKLGGNVDTADNGALAVDKFKNNAYDIVFMDCEMPEMDGFDAAREIRKVESESNKSHPTPVIAMTAYAGRGDRDNCIAAGMDDHVPKPITVNVLQEIAEKYIFQKG